MYYGMNNMYKYIVILILLFPIILHASDKRDAAYWNKKIKQAIELKIEEIKKTCNPNWSTEICSAKARVNIEMKVFAEILESDFILEDTWYKKEYLWVRIKRGGDVPLIADLQIGKFPNIENVLVKNGELIVTYKAQEAISQEQKILWGGGGYLMGILTVLLLVLAL
jgi:hypothetical protein